MSKRFLVFLAPLLVLFFAPAAFSQDPGNPDTVRVEQKLTAGPSQHIQVNLYVKNDEKLGGVVILPGFSHNQIEIKFLDDIDAVLGSSGYPIDRSQKTLKSTTARNTLEAIARDGGKWCRMPGAPEEAIDRMRVTAEINLGKKIADLNNYFILTVPSGVKAEQWIDQLNTLPEVEIAQPLPLPVTPPFPPSYQYLQGYLNPATASIDAIYTWKLPGGTGSNTTICDLEYSWNLNHLDLPPGIPTWVVPGYVPIDPFDNNHGTAVLGEMVSLDNGWGTTGAAFQASAAVAPTYLAIDIYTQWLLGTAMTYAMTFLLPGDVILIEQQYPGPRYDPNSGTQDGLIPVEWFKSWYDVILTAVGNGIHVVEAAGNGRENLDDPIYSTGNNGHWPFLPGSNSGAIIVGAGAAPAAFGGSDNDRSRLSFSNYGSRVDLQGWGERVMTTGYGSYYSAEGIDLWYTRTFGGTSSASPIVASTVALMESVNEEIKGGQSITPANMRSILINTGSPQQSGTFPSTQHIGPRPNLRLALSSIWRGDTDGDGKRAVADVIYLINYLFKGGPAPYPLQSGDCNCDGQVIVGDVIYLINYLFKGGPPPGC